MPVTYWNPAPLTASVARGFSASLARVAAEANAAAPAQEAGAAVKQTSANSAVLSPTGIGAIMEEGARPHEIAPTKGYLYLKGESRYVSVAVHHPGSPAKPYLRPAAARWANGGFQSTARVSLAGSGFR